MPERSSKRDKAKAEYVARRSRGEKVRLRDLANELGVEYQDLRIWKKEDNWEEAVPKKKRGGQPNNQNSAGHKNAAGSHKGAPPHNKNAEKDGAYSAVLFDLLTDSEKELAEKVPLESRAALEAEMQILKIREHRILQKIAQYEAAAGDALYINTAMEIRKADGSNTIYNKDSAFARILKLQEALHKVQGRIIKIADSLRAAEENERRLEMEKERLELMRIRATGSIEIEDVDSNNETVHK